MNGHDSPVVVIVFQFGKVASTSVVAWLNEAQGVEAFQCHNLGPIACRKMLERALDPAVSDYFFDHNVGQLGQIIRAGRRLTRIEKGLDPGRAIVLSMAREPLDWFRSAVVQDIVGYLELLSQISDAETGDPELGPRKKVRAGLAGMLARVVDAIEGTGGIEPFVERIQSADLADFSRRDFWAMPGGPQFFFTFTRPLVWFEEHYPDATGKHLTDFTRDGLVWRTGKGNGRYYLIRYEDMPEATREVARDAGIDPPEKMPDRNVSAEKPFAADVAEVFAGEEAARLGELARATSYARFFGYG